jgi:hypothetical protein
MSREDELWDNLKWLLDTLKLEMSNIKVSNKLGRGLGNTGLE